MFVTYLSLSPFIILGSTLAPGVYYRVPHVTYGAMFGPTALKIMGMDTSCILVRVTVLTRFWLKIGTGIPPKTSAKKVSQMLAQTIGGSSRRRARGSRGP